MPRPPRRVRLPVYYWTDASRMTTLRFTAKCSPSQYRRLDEVLALSCEMRNALLESWRGTYAWWRKHNPGAERFPAGRNLSRYDLFKMFTEVRNEDPRWSALDTRVCQGVICRFDRTTKSFYKRCAKEGTKPSAVASTPVRTSAASLIAAIASAAPGLWELRSGWWRSASSASSPFQLLRLERHGEVQDVQSLLDLPAGSDVDEVG